MFGIKFKREDPIKEELEKRKISRGQLNRMLNDEYDRFRGKLEAAKRNLNKGIIMYDNWFNALKYFKNLNEVIEYLNTQYKDLDLEDIDDVKYKLAHACAFCDREYGHRWQLVSDLALGDVSVTKIYFNTLYDKEAWEQGFKDIEKLPSGSYRVVGLRYPT